MTDLTFDPAALRALLDGETAAPWVVEHDESDDAWRVLDVEGGTVAICGYEGDANLIVALRNQGTDVLDALAAAREELAKSKRNVTTWKTRLVEETEQLRGFLTEARAEADKLRAELAEARELLHTIWYGTVNAPARERWLRLMAAPAATPQCDIPPPCGSVNPDMPFAVCAYPPSHGPIRINVVKLGEVDVEHGDGRVWWNGNTATFWADALEPDEDAEEAPCKTCGKPWRNRRHACAIQVIAEPPTQHFVDDADLALLAAAEADEDELVPHVETVNPATLAGMAAIGQMRNPEVFAPWEDDEAAVPGDGEQAATTCTCPPKTNNQKDPTIMQVEFTPAYLLGAWQEDPDCPQHGDAALPTSRQA
jgi:hypothetical protein